MTEPVLYDCDNTLGLFLKEIDDGLTILYLLGEPEIELLGITTTFGNGTIDEVERATRILMEKLGRTDIPLVRGCGRRGDEAAEAGRFLAETAASRPGQITLLATGPLGNIRAAAAIDPRFFSNIKRIVCMGGYLEPLRIGWRNLAELNFSCDPEGAHIALHAPCPITLMNAHICLSAPFGFAELKKIRHWPRWLRRVVRRWLFAFGAYCGVPRFFLWDLLPAVFLLHPHLFDENKVGLASTVADLQSGALILDGAGTSAVNMPGAIRDIREFMRVLRGAWDRALGIGGMTDNA